MRAGARRLGLIRIREMIGALAVTAERTGTGVHVLEVPALRQLGRDFLKPSTSLFPDVLREPGVAASRMKPTEAPRA